MRRPSFLTVFFTLLGVVFVAAVVARIRSYETGQGRVPAGQAAGSPVADGTAMPPEGVAEGTEASSTLLDGQSSAAARQRQARLEELLRTPPPPGGRARPSETSAATAQRTRQSPAQPAPQPEAARPSVVERVSGAVASIFGGGRSEAPAARTRPVREAPDADSDVKPPQLASVEFNPPQIRDGESTVLTIVANDDVSGVASVTGVIASPSGSVQGFAGQREGETNRYVARISVPRDAPDGLWRINHISLTDQARNGAMLGAAQGMLPPTASFRVNSSRSDSTPPVLRSIWLDQLVMRVGEPNRLYVEADDDKSGMAAVSGVFLSPQRTARVSFGCTARPDGTWECPLSPPKCLDCGRWQLEQVQLHDKANNMAVLRTDQPMVRSIQLDIVGDQCDAGAPMLSNVSVQPSVVSNTEANTVTLYATITDDTCGVSSVSGNVVGPSAAGSPRIYFTFTRGAEGSPWTAHISVPRHAASGTWRIATIQVVDRGQNLKIYNEADPVLTGVAFRVH